MLRVSSLALALILALGGTAAPAPGQIHVDADATGANDGTSWTDAHTDLQTAIDNADGNDEIWVSEGLYKPDSEWDSFTITGAKDGLKIYGGFEGTESTRSEREPEQHRTILSGDLNGDDTDPDGDGIIENADPNQDGTPENLNGGENTHHVLLLDGTSGGTITTDTVIDGVVVTAGQADGGNKTDDGGGLYCDGGESGNECSPTLRRVVFAGNAAGQQGGAICNNGRRGTSSPSITNATFTGNAAVIVGGGISNDGRGGTSSPSITNATFVTNTTGGGGGAIFNRGGNSGISSPVITNTTFAGNAADGGGAISNTARGQFGNGTTSPTIVNTILWGNSATNSGDVIENIDATTTVSHTIIQGGVNGSGIDGDPNIDDGGNTDANPRFEYAVGPAGTDGTFATDDDGLHVRPGSPAIDAGDNNAIPSGTAQDITGASRIQNGTVDIGAYEGERSVSRTIYVDAGAGAGGTGLSWSEAFSDLQTAIDNATGDDEIWVAEGIYKPDSEGDSFTITGAKDGLKIYGGFEGTESSRSARDPKQHRTILSGDLDGDDTDPDGDGIIEDAVDGQDGDGSDLQGTNATHVLVLDGTSTGITDATEINGVVVTAGMGDGDSPNNRGGGLHCNAGGATCSPTLQHVVFAGNTAGYGAGLFTKADPGGTASPLIKEAVFVGNAAAVLGKFAGATGGAIYNTGSGSGGTVGRASPTIEQTIFTGNAAAARGGAMYNEGFDDGGIANPRITNSVFEGNVAREGGAIYTAAIFFSSKAHPQITGTVFVDNVAAEGTVSNGGAILNSASDGTATLSLVNTTFTGNRAQNNGGAMHNSGEARVTNTILWGNRASGDGSEIDNVGGTARLAHTLVEGGAGGIDGGTDFLDEGGSSVSFANSTNLDDNPKFVEPSEPIGPDSAFATPDDGVIPIIGSPALDAGVNDSVDVSTGITGASRIQDQDGDGTATVSLGAYERLGRLPPEAVTGSPEAVTGTSADVTGTVDPNGAGTRVEAQIFPTADPASGRTIEGDSLSGADDQSVSVPVEDLRPNTTYEVRVRSINSEGDDSGALVAFTTGSTGPPVATTEAPSGVDATSATLEGTVTPGGAETHVTFEYRSVGSSSFISVPAAESPLTGSSEQAVHVNLGGFQPDADYEVKVTASNSEGADEGRLKTFTTAAVGMAITGGGFGGLDRTFNATPGQAHQPIGVVRLTPGQSGAALTDVTVTPNTPGVRGGDGVGLWISDDDQFDASGDTELASLDLDPQADLPSPMTFDGFTEGLSDQAQYLFVTVTLTDNASGELTAFLENETALALDGGAITEVNGNPQSGFSNLPLSAAGSTLPVELAQFEGTRVEEGVRLHWKTASEENNAGFRILRKVGTASEGNGQGDGSTEGWRTIGRRDGAGTTSDARDYRFTDAELPYGADTLAYRLKQVDTDGTTRLTDPVTVARSGPDGVELLGTAPNPARSRATVRYAVPEGTRREVTLQLFDVLGRQVRSVQTEDEPGRHEQTLDVGGLSSGVYVLRLRAGGTAKTRKFTIVH